MIPRQTRYLIAIQRPGLWALGALVLVVAAAAGMWLAYDFGQRSAGFDASEVNRFVDELEAKIASLESDLAESRRQTAMLERNSRIDDDTSDQLKKTLSEAQQEAIELKKELAFYKSIVAPEQGKRSVAIQTIQLKPVGNGSYEYKIMVTQTGRNDQFARGDVDVTVAGVLDGKTSKLALTELSEEAKKSMRFGLRYFQNFTGKLVLPENFKAETMRVKLVPKTNALDPVDETFPWEDLTAGG
jgi:hypothetical protein